jgi:hypothetical protein
LYYVPIFYEILYVLILHYFSRPCDCSNEQKNKLKKKTEKDTTKKQLRWSKPMHTLLLKILADEIAKGNKPSRTFKPASFALVAKSISEKFEVESDHVENRLRTIKNMWTVIRVALDVIKI